MAGFLVFLPGLSSPGAVPERLRTVGLVGLSADTPLFANIQHGPTGQPGGLCWWDDPRRPDTTPTTNVALHDWQAAKPDGEFPAGRFWLGREKGRPVRPSDLQRPVVHAGHAVRLADGQEWTIPVARQLPQLLGLNDAGDFARRPRPEYAEFWRDAERALSEWCFGEGIPYAAGWEFCCKALGLNYRVDRAICDWLGLFDSPSMVETVYATVEWHSLVATLKKKESEGTSDTPPTDAGEPA